MRWRKYKRLDQPPESEMATRRRQSMRTRMKVEDVSSWVEHNQQPYSPHEEPRVRFEAPPPPTGDDSDAESVESLTEKPVYKDGGYGWFVVFSSFIMHAICDGASFCFGIVFVKIQQRFKVNRVSSMFTASLFLSLPLCLSPIAGVVSDILGCRMSIIIGGSICTIACIASIFSNNIWQFTFFLGLGCGAGMSFIYNAAIVIVTYYFNKKRGTATSLAVAGTGCGTFIFPFFLTFAGFLFSYFANDLQCILIAFALAFSIIVILGLFIEDVEWASDSTDYKIRKFNKNVKTLLEDQENNSKTKKESLLRHANSLPNLNVIRVDFGSIQSVCEAGKTDGKVEIPTRSKSVALFENQPQMPTIPEYSMINTTLANLEHLDLELANSPCTTVRAQRRRVISKVSMSCDQINELDDEDFKVNLFMSSSDSTGSGEESSSDDSEMSNDGDSSSSELSEKHLEEPTAKLINKNLTAVINRSSSSAPTSARLIRNSLAPGSSNMSGGRILASNAIQSRYATNLLTMGKIPSAPMLVARKKRKSLFRAINMAIFKRMTENEFPIYRAVLKSKAYICLALSVVCLYLILDVPYVCFYDYAIEHLNLSETMAKALYSVIGCSNFFSTMIYGKLADFSRTRKYIQTIYSLSMVGVAATLISATFVKTPLQLIISGGFFGVFVTSNYVLQSILITICFDDMNLFQGAYSMISMLEGIASLIGPPIFAQIRELTGSYALVFFIAGIVALLSAFFSYLFHLELIKEQKDDEDEDDIDSIEKGEKTANGIEKKYLQEKKIANLENQNLLHV